MIEYIWFIISNKLKIILKFNFTYILYIIVTLVLPILSGKVIDTIIWRSTNASGNITIYIYIVLLSTTVILNYLLKINGSNCILELNYFIKNNIILHLFKIPIFNSMSYNVAYLNSRISNDSYIFASFITNSISSIVIKFITLCVALIILLQINVKLFICFVVIIPIYIFMYKLMKKKYIIKNRIYKEKNDEFNKVIFNSLSVLKEIKINSAINITSKEIDTSFFSLYNTTNDFLKYSEKFKSLDSVVYVAFQIISLFICSCLILKNQMTIGEYTMVATYFSYCIEAIRFFSDLSKQIQEAKVTFDRILQIKNISAEGNGIIQIKKIYNIKIMDVSFSFNSLQDFIIKNFNYTFENNHTYGLVGINGKGKSTLIDIICGLYKENMQGEIFFNNIDILNLDTIELRKKNISVMVQNTKYENCTIDYFMQFDMENIQKTIKKYELESIYYTEYFHLNKIINNSLSNLSGGEKQKICLLKALCKESDLLILDEPTSALDKESTKIFLDSLSIIKKNRILIIISHNYEIIRKCDFEIYL